MTMMTQLKIVDTLIILVLLGGSSALQAQTPDPVRRPPVLHSAGSSAGRQTEKVATNRSGSQTSASLVTIPTVVMDRNGRYIANLRKEDFRIYEDGVEQNVVSFGSIEKPFTVALLLDVSGSTQFQLAQIRDAANRFVSRLRYNDQLMAIAFDGKINVLTEPASVSAIRQSKLHIPTITDGTVLYDAVAFALKQMA